MKFKLDENIGTRGRQLFINDGLSVATVVEQNLAGSDDDTLINICRQEKRCLDITGKLWIVQKGKIRIYEEDD